MLAVPGWVESQRLPSAVAVVSAENSTARVRLDCRRFVSPDAATIPAMRGDFAVNSMPDEGIRLQISVRRQTLNL